MLSPDPAEKGHTEIILTIDCGGGSTQEEPAVAKQASLHDVAQVSSLSLSFDAR